MELGKGFSVDYKEGKVELGYVDEVVEAKASVKVAFVLNPVLDGFKAKVESGEIDPIKGTDLDKEALLKAVEFIKAELNK